jgi:hypothetical protein
MVQGRGLSWREVPGQDGHRDKGSAQRSPCPAPYSPRWGRQPQDTHFQVTWDRGGTDPPPEQGHRWRQVTAGLLGDRSVTSKARVRCANVSEPCSARTPSRDGLLPGATPPVHGVTLSLEPLDWGHWAPALPPGSPFLQCLLTACREPEPCSASWGRQGPASFSCRKPEDVQPRCSARAQAQRGAGWPHDRSVASEAPAHPWVAWGQGKEWLGTVQMARGLRPDCCEFRRHLYATPGPHGTAEVLAGGERAVSRAWVREGSSWPCHCPATPTKSTGTADCKALCRGRGEKGRGRGGRQTDRQTGGGLLEGTGRDPSCCQVATRESSSSPGRVTLSFDSQAGFRGSETLSNLPKATQHGGPAAGLQSPPSCPSSVDNSPCPALTPDLTSQAKEPKAVMKIEHLNATFQPAKIGHPHGLQVTYLKDNSTRNIFVYHEDGKVGAGQRGGSLRCPHAQCRARLGLWRGEAAAMGPALWSGLPGSTGVAGGSCTRCPLFWPWAARQAAEKGQVFGGMSYSHGRAGVPGTVGRSQAGSGPPHEDRADPGGLWPAGWTHPALVGRGQRRLHCESQVARQGAAAMVGRIWEWGGKGPRPGWPAGRVGLQGGSARLWEGRRVAWPGLEGAALGQGSGSRAEPREEAQVTWPRLGQVSAAMVGSSSPRDGQEARGTGRTLHGDIRSAG